MGFSNIRQVMGKLFEENELGGLSRRQRTLLTETV